MNNYQSLDEALDYLNESNLFTRKKKYTLDDVKKIKNSKPDEYTDDKELKHFVDKNYDKILKISEELEKEPEELNKANHRAIITQIIGFITCTTFVLFPIGFILVIIAMIDSVIIIDRAHKDSQSMNEMNKIRDSLAKIRNKGNCKDPEVQKKIDKIINNIDDASSSYERRERQISN